MAKSCVSEPLVAIFGICAKFASQCNGSCLKRTPVDAFCGQTEVSQQSPQLQNLQIMAKSCVSEPLVAIFGIYAKFASQRNGSCLKRTLLDPFCSPLRMWRQNFQKFVEIYSAVLGLVASVVCSIGTVSGK